jgi:hypothetical protein
MTIPTPELTDLAKPIRVKLEKLLHEKAVLGYGFSYTKLHKLLADVGVDANEIDPMLQDCILAVDDASHKDAKTDLNDRISAIYAEEDLKSLRAADPFGRKMDFLLYESKTAPQLSKTKLVEMAPKFNISTKRAIEWIEASTTPGKPYIALVARGVKEEAESNKAGK